MKTTKDFLLEIKSVDEQHRGTFTGFASVYGVKDLQGDVVERGGQRSHRWTESRPLDSTYDDRSSPGPDRGWD